MNIVSFELPIILLFFIILPLFLFRSFQAKALTFYLSIYSLGLVVACFLNLPLDILSYHDSIQTRSLLLKVLIVFWVSICSSAILTKYFMKKGNIKINFKSRQIAIISIVFIFFAVLVEAFISSYAGILGTYSNFSKTTYFFTYLSLPIASYLSYSKKPSLIFYFLFIVHIVLCLLNGERLMFVTAITTLAFFTKPFKLNLKWILYFFGVAFIFLLLDDIRSGSEIDLNISNRLLPSGEIVTHHGSVLYSSLVLIDYAKNNFSFDNFSDGLSYLFGLDGSRGGDGFKLNIDDFAKRGGGGLLPSFYIALFGINFGYFLTIISGFMIGSSLIKYEYQSCTYPFLLMLGLLPHSYAYTPILFFRPLLAFILIFGFINYFYSKKAKKEL